MNADTGTDNKIAKQAPMSAFPRNEGEGLFKLIKALKTVFNGLTYDFYIRW